MNLTGEGPLPQQVVDKISTYLSVPSGPFTAFDPCAQEGDNLVRLLEGTTGFGYGVEPDDNKCLVARSKGLKVLRGALQRCRISNGVFSFAIMVPLCDPAEDGERSEKFVLRETIPYVMAGGVVVMVIPKFRFDESTIKALSYRLEDLQFYSFKDASFSMTTQIVVFGKKKKHPFLDADTVEYWKPFIDTEVAELTEAFLPFFEVPPCEPEEVKLFRSGIIDLEELEQSIEASPVWDMVKGNEIAFKRGQPILPPHKGQFGLGLTAGMVDGVVGSGVNVHLVKGRSVKDKFYTVDEDTGEEVVQELLKCTVKAWRPSGELLTLVGDK